jgi:hypothetical protein
MHTEVQLDGAVNADRIYARVSAAQRCVSNRAVDVQTLSRQLGILSKLVSHGTVQSAFERAAAV